MLQKNKRTISLLLLILIVAVISCSLLLYQNQQNISKTTQMKLESIAGSALYNIWNGYQIIGSSDPQDLTSEKVMAISNQLSRIAVYSAVMDQATGAVLLGPIAEKLTALLEDISSDTTYTNADLEKYRTLLQFANELHPLLNDYYVPDTVEGAKVSLELDEKSKLLDLDAKIKSFMSQ